MPIVLPTVLWFGRKKWAVGERDVRGEVRRTTLNHVALFLLILVVSVWSSGMIPASGAGGPGFKPRNGPLLLHYHKHSTSLLFL